MRKLVDFAVMVVALMIGIAAVKFAAQASIGRMQNKAAQAVNSVLQAA